MRRQVLRHRKAAATIRALQGTGTVRRHFAIRFSQSMSHLKLSVCFGSGPHIFEVNGSAFAVPGLRYSQTQNSDVLQAIPQGGGSGDAVVAVVMEDGGALASFALAVPCDDVSTDGAAAGAGDCVEAADGSPFAGARDGGADGHAITTLVNPKTKLGYLITLDIVRHRTARTRGTHVARSARTRSRRLACAFREQAPRALFPR